MHAPLTLDDISLTDVTKVFKIGLLRRKIGVKNVTFQVAPGEVVGLLGPNGSGKSTILKMILGFLHPTKGEILVAGYRNYGRQARGLIGYLPENPRFQKFLTAHRVLCYYGSLLNLRGKVLKARCDELLELVNLKIAANERVKGFSKGMTQRLAIAQALINEPRLLIFDEPMSGLDPIGRIEIRKLISRIHGEYPKSTLLFSSHILSDIEQVCSSVIVMKKGHLTRHCRIDELLGSDPQRFEVTVQNLPESLSAKYRSEGLMTLSPLGSTLLIEGTDGLVGELSHLREMGARIIGLTSRRKTLEEALFAEPESPQSGNLKQAEV